MLYYFLLTPMASDDTSAVNLTEVTFVWESPLFDFKILFVSRLFIMMCLGVTFFECILLGVHWVSWMCRLLFPIKFWKFLAIIFSNIFSCLCLSFLFWDSQYAYGVPLRLCSFFFIPFCSVPKMNNLNWSVFKFMILSSPYSSLLPGPSSNFFICYSFQPQSFYLFFIISIFLLVSSIWWDIVLIFPFSSFTSFPEQGGTHCSKCVSLLLSD